MKTFNMKTFFSRALTFISIISTLLVSGICQGADTIPNDSDCSSYSKFREPPYPSCEPVVMIIRHAEDYKDVHELTEPGKNHARLYITLFEKYIHGDSHLFDKTEKCACEIDKIIAINPDEHNNSNAFPSPNPYETIKPLESRLGIPISIADDFGTAYGSNYEWTQERRLTLLNPDHKHSTVIAWDKQGLNPSDDNITKAANYDMTPKLGQPDKSLIGAKGYPLLKTLPAFFPKPLSWACGVDEKGDPKTCFFVPERDYWYVLALQQEDGKFSYTRFNKQLYSDKDNADDQDTSWYPSSILTTTPRSIKTKHM